ncbi:hypothetical protein [Levilactobacillus brevis]|uniref:hypothetical protein n=1 Tax=Levilactobacillus brevis TaxID=1580 RepID=UPI00339CDDF9
MNRIEIDERPIFNQRNESLDYNADILDNYFRLHLKDGVNCSISMRSADTVIEIFSEYLSSDFNAEHIYKAILEVVHNGTFLQRLELIVVQGVTLNSKSKITIHTSSYCLSLKSILEQTCFFDSTRIRLNADLSLNGHVTSPNLKLILNNNEKRRLHLLEHNAVDLTWCASGNVHELRSASSDILQNYTFVNKRGHNVFFLKSANEELRTWCVYLRREIQNAFLRKQTGQVDAIETWSSFMSKIESQNFKIEENKLLPNIIKLGYADYYPNQELPETIKGVFQRYHIEVVLQKFDSLKTQIFHEDTCDMVLGILSPSFSDEASIPLQLLTPRNFKEAGNLLNHNNITSITSDSIPIFCSRVIYWRNKRSKLDYDNYGKIILTT